MIFFSSSSFVLIRKKRVEMIVEQMKYVLWYGCTVPHERKITNGLQLWLVLYGVRKREPSLRYFFFFFSLFVFVALHFPFIHSFFFFFGINPPSHFLHTSISLVLSLFHTHKHRQSIVLMYFYVTMYNNRSTSLFSYILYSNYSRSYFPLRCVRFFWWTHGGKERQRRNVNLIVCMQDMLSLSLPRSHVEIFCLDKLLSCYLKYK